jgi:hypothetical protein
MEEYHAADKRVGKRGFVRLPRIGGASFDYSKLT